MFSVSVINPSAGLADSFAEPVTAATLAPNREFDLAPGSNWIVKHQGGDHLNAMVALVRYSWRA